MSRPLEVLLVAPHAVVGGQEQWLLQLLGATDRLRSTALLLQDGPFRDALASAGVPVDVLTVGRRPQDLVLPVLRLAARLRRERPDVVLANGAKAQFVAGPAARLAGVPVVFVRHDHSFEGLAKRLGRLADRVVGGTHEVLEAVQRPDAVVVEPPLPHAAPLPREAARERLRALGVPLPPSGPVLVMATRLVPYKGVDDAITALTLPGGRDWSLVVLGGPDPAAPGERERLLEVADGLGVADRVRLVGHVPGAGALLAAFDALAVLTRPGSRREPGAEAFGMTAMEAMVAGLPVVAVQGGAIERRLGGQAGLVVPPADPVAVALALGRLGDAGERARRGSAGRRRTADHPRERETADLLCAVLAEAARRPGAGRRPVAPVSVLVPVHDEGEGVDAVVAAVVAQLRDGDELVVVDDGSTDATPDRLAALAEVHPQLVVERLPVNAGPAAARNAATRLARHELLVCTDAGNLLPAGWLDGLRTALEEPLAPDLVTGAYEVSRDSPVEQAMAAALYPVLRDVRAPTPAVRLHGRLFGRTMHPARPAGRSLAYRRSAWERAGGWPEHLRGAEDVAFGTALAAGGRAVLQTDAPAVWVQHGTLQATARMYAGYGRGDGLAGDRTAVLRDLVRAGALLAVGPLAVSGRRPRRALALGGAAYLSLPLLRAGSWRAAAAVPVVLVVKDVSKAVGCLRGLLEARRR